MCFPCSLPCYEKLHFSYFFKFYQRLYFSIGIAKVNFTADPYYVERNGLYIGQGTTMLSRAGIFRVSEGVAVDMSNRVFQLPSFNGTVSFSCSIL